MRKRLVIMAWINIAIGGAGVGLLAALVSGFVAARDPEYNDEFAVLGGILGLFTLIYFLPMFLGGIGVLRRKVWGRALIWGVTPVLALATPVGTLLAGFNLWAMITTVDTSAAFSSDSIARIERIVRNALRNIVLILIAMFILGVIVGVGWLFRDQIDPPRQQILTPIPEMPKFDAPEFKAPEFNLPERPPAPGQ